jgi:hypothetical protein
MGWRWSRRVAGAARRLRWRDGRLVAAACALALASCQHDGRPSASAAPWRGATVAFESIDGPPPGQFQTLVRTLNDEAQARRLAVISRESQSVYRVRGYLAAKVTKGQTTIAWVWDVFDRDEHRAVRISGEEIAKERHRDAWTAADEAMLRRIARASMDQLAAFLASPEDVPADAEPRVALLGQRSSSPEAAGIFRIVPANADPVPAQTAEGPAGENGSPVPVPRRRPSAGAAASAGKTLTLAAAQRPAP